MTVIREVGPVVGRLTDTTKSQAVALKMAYGEARLGNAKVEMFIHSVGSALEFSVEHEGHERRYQVPIGPICQDALRLIAEDLGLECGR